MKPILMLFLFIFKAKSQTEDCVVLQCTLQQPAGSHFLCCFDTWNKILFPWVCKLPGEVSGNKIDYKPGGASSLERNNISYWKDTANAPSPCIANWKTWSEQDFQILTVNEWKRMPHLKHFYQVEDFQKCCSESTLFSAPGFFPKIIAPRSYPASSLGNKSLCCDCMESNNYQENFQFISDRQVNFQDYAYNLSTYFRAVGNYLMSSSVPLTTSADLRINGDPYITVEVLRQDTINQISKNSISKFSQSKIISVNTNQTFSSMKYVHSEIHIPKSLQFTEVSSWTNKIRGTVVSLFQPKNVPVVSTSVYSKSGSLYESVQAMPTFAINIENETGFTDYVQSLSNKEDGRGRTIIRSMKYVCQYFDKRTETYSNSGCEVRRRTKSEIACYCNHTTIFAVLLSIESHKIPEVVKIVSFATESISVFCLILAFLALWQARKRIRNDRTIVQLNLTLSLLMLHLFLLFHDLALRNDKACEAFAVFIHFFLLSSASWMFIEGYTLLMKTTNRAFSISSDVSTTVMRKRMVVGWGIPIIIVFVSICVGAGKGIYEIYFEKSDYGQGYLMCWINRKTNMLLGAAFIPILVLYCINFAIVIKVLVFIYEKTVEARRLQPSKRNEADNDTPNHLLHIIASLKGILLLFPVLGIPWIFSFLSGLEENEAGLGFMYLNVILNGLQGLFLMLVYCVFGSEVRKTWLRILKQKLTNFEALEKKNSRSTHRTVNDGSATAEL